MSPENPFGGSGGSNDDPTTPPGPPFTIPAFRTFVVRRKDRSTREYAEIRVVAHMFSYELGPSGNVVAFYDYYLDENLGPMRVLRRLFAGFDDVEEVYVTKSGSIVH